MQLVWMVAAAASTFTRFFPRIKGRYDYGVLIFILTFSMVAVSGYRVEAILEMAHERLLTIVIGGGTCMVLSAFVCPVWAGEDLHKLTASNIEMLANYLEGKKILKLAQSLSFFLLKIFRPTNSEEINYRIWS